MKQKMLRASSRFYNIKVFLLRLAVLTGLFQYVLVERLQGVSVNFRQCNKLSTVHKISACYGETVAKDENTPYYDVLMHCLLFKINQQLESNLMIITEQHDVPAKLKEIREYGDEFAVHGFSLTSDQEILQHLLHLQAENYKVFAVLCSIECTAKIMRVAFLHTYTTDSGFVWITFHYELAYLHIDLPMQLINININGNISMGNCTGTIVTPACIDTLTNVCNSYDSYDQLMHLHSASNKTFWKPLINPIDFSRMADNLRTGHRKKMRVVTIKKFPYLIMNEVDPDQLKTACRLGRICTKYNTINGTKTKRKNCCYGLEIDLLKQLESDIGFETDLYLVEDGFFGGQVNGTWNGLVADLQYHKADFALATLSLTAERSAVIDFCEPFAEENSALLTTAVEHTDAFLNMKIFSAFSMRLWVTVVMGLFVSSFLLSLIEKIRTASGTNTYPWIESLSYLIGLFVEKEIGAKDPRTLTARFMAIFIALGTLALVSTYTAVLTADLVDTHIDYLASGIRDPKLTEEGSALRFGLLASSSWTAYFRDTHDEELKKLYDSSNKFEYKTLQQGIDMLRDGRLQAIINDEKVLKDHSCRETKAHFHVTKEVVKLIGMGIAVPKKSKLMYKISDYIRLYKEDGLLEAIEKKWLKTDCPSDNDELGNSINIQAFGGAFVLLCSGIALSLMIFIWESCYIRVIAKNDGHKQRKSFWI